jgi:hypothetical protein
MLSELALCLEVDRWCRASDGGLVSGDSRYVVGEEILEELERSSTEPDIGMAELDEGEAGLLCKGKERTGRAADGVDDD